MHIKLPTTAFAAAIFLLTVAGRAQTFLDNAGHYKGNYANQGGSTPGFGPFHVAVVKKGGGAAGTFLYSAAIAEGNQGTRGVTPSTINTPATATSKQPQAFGFFANGHSKGVGDPAVTITRAFKVPGRAGLSDIGDSFSLDFVTGYNDGGTSGVALTTNHGVIGSFLYQAGGRYLFNGAATGRKYTNGALHLRYTLTSKTTYSLQVTGAVSFSGTGKFTVPITGFQVQQTNSAGNDPAHNGFFNNLALRMTRLGRTGFVPIAATQV